MVMGRAQLVAGVVEELPLVGEGVLEPVEHAVERARELGDLVGPANLQAPRQVGGTDLLGRAAHVIHRSQHPARGHPGQGAGDEESDGTRTEEHVRDDVDLAPLQVAEHAHHQRPTRRRALDEHRDDAVGDHAALGPDLTGAGVLGGGEGGHGIRIEVQTGRRLLRDAADRHPVHQPDEGLVRLGDAALEVQLEEPSGVVERCPGHGVDAGLGQRAELVDLLRQGGVDAVVDARHEVLAGDDEADEQGQRDQGQLDEQQPGPGRVARAPGPRG
jgi:hypothetical protein